VKTNRIIIAGGRSFKDWGLFKMKVSSYILLLDPEDTEIVSGGQVTIDKDTGKKYGADYFAKCYAAEYHYPYKEFAADWDRWGKSAGPIRNRAMAVYGTHLIAFWDGKSLGTWNMIEEARQAGLKVKVVEY
jgi:hypothetical protein